MLTIYVYDNLLENLSDLTMLMLYPSTEVKKLSRKDPFKSYLKRAVISIQNKRRVYGNFYYTSTVINTFEDFYSFFFQKEIVDKSLI